MLENFDDDFVALRGEVFEDIDGGAPVSGFCFTAALEAHLIEQNFADLFG